MFVKEFIVAVLKLDVIVRKVFIYEKRALPKH